jgi:ubiquinone/menaquinone biosynthesis C-methylase UbiE
MPIEIRFNGSMIHGQLTSMSENGASFTSREAINHEYEVSLFLQLPQSTEAVQIGGKILWRQEGKSESGYEYGMHIVDLPGTSRKILSSWMAESLIAPGGHKDRRSPRTINSQLVTYKNRQGKNLVGFIDSLIETDDQNSPYVIVTPGFGEIKTNALSISYFLVKNGFKVLRYDASDHTGESDGSIFNCTLSKMGEDVLSSLDFLEKEYGCNRVGVIATSLSSLAVIKAAATDSRVAFVGGLVPVVNLQHTLREVYNEDLVGKHLSGHKWGAIDILGFPIDADQFLSDSVQAGYHSLESIRKIMEGIRAPIHFIVGSNDPWVLERDIKEALGPLPSPRRQYSVIQSSMHQLHENPMASKTALIEIVRASIKHLKNETVRADELKQPNLREVAIQSRIERERRKLTSISSKTDEVQFWSSYLNQFTFIMRVPDFRQFFVRIGDLMGPVSDGQVILDAGCGNGSYGLWLIKSIVDQYKDAKRIQIPRLNYIGLDFVSSALEEARKVHARAMRDISEVRQVSGYINFVYTLADLDHRLPFMDNYFDKICCNLVLSYVHHPQNTLKELYRVLAPGGKLLITTLKPFADLSAVYKSFVEQATTSEDILEARKLLTNAGAIRSKESEGYFKFFGENELMGMMLSIGAKDPMVCRSFANQANIAVVKKP